MGQPSEDGSRPNGRKAVRAGPLLSASLPTEHRAVTASLFADSDLAHETHNIVEEVLLHDLSVLPARDSAEIHLK